MEASPPTVSPSLTQPAPAAAACPRRFPTPASGLSAVACAAPASLYLHIPFCRTRCTYCDFASYPGLDAVKAPYVAALIQEARLVGESWGRPDLDTIYIGGGTPTILPAALLAETIEAIAQAFHLSPEAEVTVEANPGTVTLPALSELRRAGANRLSLGVQSFQPALLTPLGRIHTADEAVQGVHLTRQAGFGNVSLDLIYGLPGQSPDDWQADLTAVLALEPEHLSLYALTLEPNTPLAARVFRHEVPEPDTEQVAAMYEQAQAALQGAGYDHYEISNWARRRPGDPDLRSQHNLTYWLNRPYLGCGAAAHSWARGCRTANIGHPHDYVERLRRGKDPVGEEERIGPELERAETMVLGLRLIDGVDRAWFRSRFGLDPAQLYPTAIVEGQADGLLEMDEQAIRLTPRGRLLGNQVLWRFLP